MQVVPGAGGFLSEAIDLWVNPLERRKARWVQEVTTAINQICDDLSILPEQLAKDERFLSFLMQTTLSALRSHQNEKLTALREALAAACDASRFSEDEAFVYLRYVDELTPTHVALLASVRTNRPNLADLTSLESIFELVSAKGLTIERMLFRTCLRDLSLRSLVAFDDIEDFHEYETRRVYRVTESSANRPLTITETGNRFLSFVALGS